MGGKNLRIVTVQELAISNMLEIEALRELLFEKGRPEYEAVGGKDAV